jgi:hypothetical protein
MYLFEWLLTAFTRSLPLPVALHIWDNLFLEGFPFLVRASLGLVRLLRPSLLGASFPVCLELLQNPPSTISADELFENIKRIKLLNAKETALLQ